MIRRPTRSTRTDTLFPYTTLFRSQRQCACFGGIGGVGRHFRPQANHVRGSAKNAGTKIRWQKADATTAAYHEQTGTDESRSEEHTSELQSLMRISYAVFCLKKKIHIYLSISIPSILTHTLFI